MNEVIKSADAGQLPSGSGPASDSLSENNNKGQSTGPELASKSERDNKALALMVQPSIDYGKWEPARGLAERTPLAQTNIMKLAREGNKAN